MCLYLVFCLAAGQPRASAWMLVTEVVILVLCLTAGQARVCALVCPWVLHTNVLILGLGLGCRVVSCLCLGAGN